MRVDVVDVVVAAAATSVEAGATEVRTTEVTSVVASAVRVAARVVVRVVDGAATEEAAAVVDSAEGTGTDVVTAAPAPEHRVTVMVELALHACIPYASSVGNR